MAALLAVLSVFQLGAASPLEYIVDVDNGKLGNPLFAAAYYRKIRSPLFPRVGKRMTDPDEYVSSSQLIQGLPVRMALQ
ncbi:unnamed protein product [Echinostoma caproni]|uniref:Secreted protein n=1 Tax=Echinostoma caproni TaxID=27848 RepID=A0A183AKQ0_9TREM|nr:unnamed protein product [Echinostoma caproni]